MVSFRIKKTGKLEGDERESGLKNSKKCTKEVFYRDKEWLVHDKAEEKVRIKKS